MIRSVAIVAAAIKLTQPGMGDATAKAYATITVAEAKRRNFDPFTLVSIVRNESRWNPRVVGGMDGACYGFGQKCAHYVPVCREHGLKSAECVAHMSRYLVPANGLRQVASDITENRKVCRRITGKPALFARWLSAYQGFNDHRRSGRRDVWCNMKKDRRGVWRDVRTPKLTRKVMRYRITLIRKLDPPRRP